MKGIPRNKHLLKGSKGRNDVRYESEKFQHNLLEARKWERQNIGSSDKGNKF